jgi:alkylated DNA repair protein (DNA oxidative demethylase)
LRDLRLNRTAAGSAQGELALKGEAGRERLGDGAVLLRGYAAAHAAALVAEVAAIAAAATFRRMQTPRGAMSVAMTACGDVGWVSDKAGYRYSAQDPLTGRAWPAMPALFRALASDCATACGFADYAPDTALINEYAPGAKLSLHQDRDEGDLGAPVVSVSLGLPAVFVWGGLARRDPVRRWRLESGDVVVFGGPSRLVHHGVEPVPDGTHALTGRRRLNLTFRRARAA